MEIEYKKDFCGICGKQKIIIVIRDENQFINTLCCKRCFKEINDKAKVIK